jgi:hypothetical protein
MYIATAQKLIEAPRITNRGSITAWRLDAAVR